MIGQNLGYIRVSTFEQNDARQLQDVKLDKKFIDRASGGSKDRPQLQAMLSHAREGDVIYVHSMDRLARNLVDLRQIVTEITQQGIVIKFYKEGLTFSSNQNDAMSKLILNMMGSFAEFERELIHERQREGIEQAKKAGKYKGRKPSLSEDQRIEIKKRISSDEKINKAALAREYNISRESLYRYLREE